MSCHVVHKKKLLMTVFADNSENDVHVSRTNLLSLGAGLLPSVVTTVAVVPVDEAVPLGLFTVELETALAEIGSLDVAWEVL